MFLWEWVREHQTTIKHSHRLVENNSWGDTDKSFWGGNFKIWCNWEVPVLGCHPLASRDRGIQKRAFKVDLRGQVVKYNQLHLTLDCTRVNEKGTSRSYFPSSLKEGLVKNFNKSWIFEISDLRECSDFILYYLYLWHSRNNTENINSGFKLHYS